MNRDGLDDHLSTLMDSHDALINSAYFVCLSESILNIDDAAADAYLNLRNSLDSHKSTSLWAFELRLLQKVVESASFEFCDDASGFLRLIVEGFDKKVQYLRRKTVQAEPARVLFDLTLDAQSMCDADKAEDRKATLSRIVGHINALGRALNFDGGTFARLQVEDWGASLTPQQKADMEREFALDVHAF